MTRTHPADRRLGARFVVAVTLAVVAALTASMGSVPSARAADRGTPPLAAAQHDRAPATASGRYVPEEGALFSNPFADRERKNLLAHHIQKAIRKAKKNSIVRIAVYSFNRQDLANTIVDACKRKVVVQIVVNDNIITPQIKQVQRLLGKKTTPRWKDACHPRDRTKKLQPYPNPSFLVVCDWSCRYRDGIGNQHIKMYLFEHTGAAHYVLMFGSNNMTDYAAYIHWNDLYTIDEQPQMFSDWSYIFTQLAMDQHMVQPYAVFTEPPYVSEFGPKARARGDDDPIAQRLSQVDCTAQPGYGYDGHTVIKVTMYAWVGSRGIDLAERVAKLARKGCRVKAILSSPGAYVVGTLRAAGVEMRSADLNLDHNIETGFDETPWEKFTHEKWMTVDGTYAGAPAKVLWTGSENWANKSFWNDELTVQIPFAKAVRTYKKHFDYVWKSHTRRVGRQYARELDRFWARQRELRRLGRPTLLD